MYCGDETGSFIGDIGSHTSRFGYGGEDAPKYVVPSYAATSHKIPSSCYSPSWADQDLQSALRTAAVANYEHPVVDPTSYLQQGDSVANWETYEALWQSAFDTLHTRDRLKHSNGGGDYKKEAHSEGSAETRKAASGVQSTTIRPTPVGSDGKCIHPLLMVAPGCTHQVGSARADHANVHRKDLVAFTELAMESLECPALFVAPAPMLAAFSHGRQTALVVDVGAGGCRVTPVVDGLLLKQAQRRSGRGGDWLGNIQWKALVAEKNVVRPRYFASANAATTSSKGIFHRWAMQDLMYELRTSEHVQLATWRYDPTVPFLQSVESGDDDDKMRVDAPPPPTVESTYQLPDGTLVDLTSPVGRDLCRIPELLFTDEIPFVDHQIDKTSILAQHATLSNLPLHKLIHASLSSVGDVDMRRELAASILLTGGSSLFAHIEPRLSLEVSRVVSGAYKAKIVASRFSVERHSAAWIGASVLTSLGSFQQLWLSRAEYEEYGPTLAVQRFP